MIEGNSEELMQTISKTYTECEDQRARLIIMFETLQPNRPNREEILRRLRIPNKQKPN